MSDEVKPTLEDLTECWCGYKAPHARELMLHQLYCDPHNTAPKVIDDQRKRIAELEAQLAAAQAEIARLRSGGCAREQGTTQYCAEAQRLAERCRLLEKHIWHDDYEAAKELGEFDDDAEIIANKAIELLKQEAAHSGEANQ